jgi:hypothetical protein
MLSHGSITKTSQSKSIECGLLNIFWKALYHIHIHKSKRMFFFFFFFSNFFIVSNVNGKHFKEK